MKEESELKPALISYFVNKAKFLAMPFYEQYSSLGYLDDYITDDEEGFAP